MNNYFYNKLNNKNYSQDFLASIEQFANNNKIQIYVLSNPLTDNKYVFRISKQPKITRNIQA